MVLCHLWLQYWKKMFSSKSVSRIPVLQCYRWLPDDVIQNSSRVVTKLFSTLSINAWSILNETCNIFLLHGSSMLCGARTPAVPWQYWLFPQSVWPPTSTQITSWDSNQWYLVMAFSLLPQNPWRSYRWKCVMTVSWHGNTFCITDIFWGESTSYWWIPLMKIQ